MKHNFSDYKHFGEYNETQWRLQRIYVQFTCLRAPASNCEEDECGGVIELLFLFTSNITAEETLIEYCQLSSWDPTHQTTTTERAKQETLSSAVSSQCMWLKQRFTSVVPHHEQIQEISLPSLGQISIPGGIKKLQYHLLLHSGSSLGVGKR